MRKEYGYSQLSRRGEVAFLAGRMAEESVADYYEARGFRTIASRWRSTAGEIDLIVERDGALVFVEVKKADNHELAAARISRRQMDRICAAACDFVGKRYNGQAVEMRFDAALVDGLGRIDVIANAFGEN